MPAISFQGTSGNLPWISRGMLPMYSAVVSTSFVIPALVTGSTAQLFPRRDRPSIASCAFLFACIRCQRTRSRSAIQPHDIAGNVRAKLGIDGALIDKVDAVAKVPAQFIAQA